MSDFISDDEMDKMESAGKAKSMPDFIPDDHPILSKSEPSIGHEYLPKESFGQKILGGVESAGKAIDAYTGAPTRAALTGKNPYESAEKFVSQFGKDSSLAPSGEELALRAGAPEGVPSKALGLGIDVAADWTNVIPPIEAAKMGAKALGFGGHVAAQGAEMAGRGAAKATDVITGTKIGEKTVGLAEDAADKVRKTTSALKDIYFNRMSPTLSPDFPAVKEMAKRQGVEGAISPALEFGPESVITRKTRFLAESPLGEPLRNEHQKGLDILENALQQKIREVNKGKSPMSPGAAGSALKDDMASFREGLIGDDDLLFGDIVSGKNAQPGLMLDKDAFQRVQSKINGIEKQAKGLSLRGASEGRAQGADILREIEAFKANKPSFKQMHEYMKQIGEVAFPKKSINEKYSFDTKAYQDIYFSLRDALLETVDKHVNPEWAQEIAKNNEKWSTYKTNWDNLAKLEQSSPSEKFISKIFADSNNIEAAKKTMSPQAFDNARQSWIQNRVPRSADDSINWGTFKNDLRRNRDIYASLFTSEEMQALDDLSHMGANYGPMQTSSSRTGETNQWIEMIKHPLDAINRISANVSGIDSLEKMKAAARSSAPSLTTKAGSGPIKSLLGEEGSISSDVAKSVGKRMIGKRETPLGQGAKIDQVIGAQSVESDKANQKEKIKEYIKKKKRESSI